MLQLNKLPFSESSLLTKAKYQIQWKVYIEMGRKSVNYNHRHISHADIMFHPWINTMQFLFYKHPEQPDNKIIYKNEIFLHFEVINNVCSD